MHELYFTEILRLQIKQHRFSPSLVTIPFLVFNFLVRYRGKVNGRKEMNKGGGRVVGRDVEEMHMKWHIK